MKRYRSKPEFVNAIQFETNNEIEPTNMNEIVKWVNQSRTNVRAWHDGTNIFIINSEGEARAFVGDYIVRDDDEIFYVWDMDMFEEQFEEIVE